jgi:glycerol-3-phosphate dehydrogenase
VKTGAVYDLLVVGGGINGAGIARDAAGRGYSVLLCEQDDLAAHTSSASTKLIHGGLRYLEQYEFGLVRKALIEREVLLRAAPHLIRPLRFVMPHDSGQRPAWLLRLGFFLYDHLAHRALLPASRALDLRSDPAGAPLRPGFRRGYAYADAAVDDARLVVLNAVDAAVRGARILTRTRCGAATRGASSWRARLHGPDGDIDVEARCIVNAAGAWSAGFQREHAPQAAHPELRLIKGSHIVVPKLFEHDSAYIFQHPDGRIVFAIPYEGAYTLIGTTDVEYHGDPGKVAIDAEETAYLCALVSRYFRRPVTPAEVVWTYAGVRPLVEDTAARASAVTRDYQLLLERSGAPMLSVFGGKITTFRKLAEEAVDMLGPALGAAPARWTGQACLPGGDLHGAGPENAAVLHFDRFVATLRARYTWLPAPLALRYARAYGTLTHTMLADAGSLRDMGEEIVPGLYAAEARYLMRHEWARTAEDILWRRSKLGLHLPPGAASVLAAWMAEEAVLN